MLWQEFLKKRDDLMYFLPPPYYIVRLGPLGYLCYSLDQGVYVLSELLPA